jgi:hypothetical protein
MQPCRKDTITRTCLPSGTACTTPKCAGDVEFRIGGAGNGGIEILPNQAAHVTTIKSLTTLANAGCAPLL